MNNNMKYCTATNVNQPNMNGTARSRTLHLTGEKPRLTVCNMLIVEIFTPRMVANSVFNDRRCKICFGKYPALADVKRPKGENKLI